MRRAIWIVTVLLLTLAAAGLIPSATFAQGNAQTATVTASALNVRTGPGVNYGVIGLAYRGETYPVLHLTRGWTQVHYKGQSAWMATGYLRISGAPVDSAVTGPTSG